MTNQELIEILQVQLSSFSSRIMRLERIASNLTPPIPEDEDLSFLNGLGMTISSLSYPGSPLIDMIQGQIRIYNDFHVYKIEQAIAEKQVVPNAEATYTIPDLMAWGLVGDARFEVQ